MHMTVDHVEEGSVLYELLYCISFKIFITQSELEVKGIHNRCNLLATFIKLWLRSCYKFYAEIQTNLSIKALLLTWFGNILLSYSVLKGVSNLLFTLTHVLWNLFMVFTYSWAQPNIMCPVWHIIKAAYHTNSGLWTGLANMYHILNTALCSIYSVWLQKMRELCVYLH